MKKFFTYFAVLCIIAVVVVLIVLIREAQTQPPMCSVDNLSKENREIYPTSSVCRPCSSVDIIKGAKEIIESPEVLKFRGGRAVNTSEARKRYKGCNKITPLCYTHNIVEAKQMETKLIRAFYNHPKCDNIANDARGKTSRNGDPNYIYIKTIERFCSRV
jgi:hypothetical protein